MRHHWHLGLLSSLLFISGCNRAIETRINGRTAQTIQAEARPTYGGWDVSLRLPAGKWTVKSTEGTDTLRVVDLPTGQEVQWMVSSDRWRNGDRPFLFRLEGSGNTALEMEVRYGNLPTTPRVLLKVLYFVAGGRVISPN